MLKAFIKRTLMLQNIHNTLLYRFLYLPLNVTMTRPSQQRHVHPGDATSIATTPRLYGRRHDSTDDATTLRTTPRLSRRRHASPVVGTPLPSSARLSRRRHASPVVGTPLPSSARPSRRRHGLPNKATALMMVLDAYQRSRAFSNPPGRSLTIKGVL